jgi:hypothetical protein
MPADFPSPEHKQPNSSIEAINCATLILQSSEVDSPQFRLDKLKSSDEAINAEISEMLTQIQFKFENNSLSPEIKVKSLELLNQAIELIR